MNQQFVGNAPSLLLKQADRTLQVDCVPEDDCGHYQAKSAHAIPLMLISQNHFFHTTIAMERMQDGFRRLPFFSGSLNMRETFLTCRPSHFVH
jgi:hypothetical protein